MTHTPERASPILRGIFFFAVEGMPNEKLATKGRKKSMEKCCPTVREDIHFDDNNVGNEQQHSNYKNDANKFIKKSHTKR